MLFLLWSVFWKTLESESVKGISKNLLLENACGFSRRKNGNFPFREEKENRNADRSRGFLPVLWPERCQAGSDSEVFRSALKRLFWLKNCKIKKNIVE